MTVLNVLVVNAVILVVGATIFVRRWKGNHKVYHLIPGFFFKKWCS